MWSATMACPCAGAAQTRSARTRRAPGRAFIVASGRTLSTRTPPDRKHGNRRGFGPCTMTPASRNPGAGGLRVALSNPLRPRSRGLLAIAPFPVSSSAPERPGAAAPSHAGSRDAPDRRRHHRRPPVRRLRPAARGGQAPFTRTRRRARRAEGEGGRLRQRGQALRPRRGRRADRPPDGVARRRDGAREPHLRPPGPHEDAAPRDAGRRREGRGRHARAPRAARTDAEVVPASLHAHRDDARDQGRLRDLPRLPRLHRGAVHDRARGLGLRVGRREARRRPRRGGPRAPPRRLPRRLRRPLRLLRGALPRPLRPRDPADPPLPRQCPERPRDAVPPRAAREARLHLRHPRRGALRPGLEEPRRLLRALRPVLAPPLRGGAGRGRGKALRAEPEAPKWVQDLDRSRREPPADTAPPGIP